MASAPRPGVGERLELDAEVAAQMDKGIRVVCGAEGKDVSFLFGDLNSTDETECIREVGVSPFNLMEQAAVHTSVIVFYWIGLRQLGEKRSLDELFKTYGSPRTFPSGQWEMFEIEPGDDAAVPTRPGEPSPTPSQDGPASTDSTPGTSEAPGS